MAAQVNIRLPSYDETKGTWIWRFGRRSEPSDFVLNLTGKRGCCLRRICPIYEQNLL